MTPKPEDDVVGRVLVTAKGYGEALATHHHSVQQVLALAGHDRSVLEAARDRARAEGEAAATESEAVVDVVPEASALVAFKLLDEAIAELDREGP